MNLKTIERELAFCKLILSTLATGRQLTSSPYMRQFLDELTHRTTLQVAALHEVLRRSDEFTVKSAPSAIAPFPVRGKG